MVTDETATWADAAKKCTQINSEYGHLAHPTNKLTIHRLFTWLFNEDEVCLPIRHRKQDVKTFFNR